MNKLLKVHLECNIYAGLDAEEGAEPSPPEEWADQLREIFEDAGCMVEILKLTDEGFTEEVPQ